MIQDYNYNLTENKNGSFSEENKNISNNNNLDNIFSLYNSFLTKENLCNVSLKRYKDKPKEILPDYSNIETQINTDKNLIKNIYKKDPIFKDTIEQDASIRNFKSGFKNLFFGPHGFITKKNSALKKFYKSFEKKKVNLNEKLFIGSMEFFDSLGTSNAYNKRLKSNRKRLFQMNGNFDISHPRLIKMKTTYQNFRHKKLGISNEKIKNKKLNENIKSENNKIKNKRFSQFYKSHNLFLDYKNNLIQDNNTLKPSLIKGRKSIKQITTMNFFKFQNFLNISEINDNTKKSNSQKKINSIISEIKPIPNKNLSIKTIPNSKEKLNKSIKNLKKEIAKTEKNINENNNVIDKKNKNKDKKAIEDYASKPINFAQYFKQKKELKKYVNSFQKSFNKKLFSSNNSNHKIRDKLNHFIINNEKYVVKTNNYFKKKMEEPYNEFKEDSKNEENFREFAKNVDFSNRGFISKDKKDDKINTINMAYSFKVSLGRDIPVKEYIMKMKRKKEKENEIKILKSVRLHFKANSKIIHNLTISLDDIKKKYNY